MAKDYCDNADCEGDDGKMQDIVLTKEFESEECTWCDGCVARDYDMIYKISGEI